MEVIKKSPTPSIGRIVHYRSYGTPNHEYMPEIRVAIITAVNLNTPDPMTYEQTVRSVALCVLNPTGMFFNVDVKEGTEPGQWSWPSRVM